MLSNNNIDYIQYKSNRIILRWSERALIEFYIKGVMPKKPISFLRGTSTKVRVVKDFFVINARPHFSLRNREMTIFFS